MFAQSTKWPLPTVLKVLAHSVQLEIDANKKQKKKKKSVLQPFVKEGGDISGHKVNRKAGLIEEAKDWELRVDLKKRLVVPQHICVSGLRPDMILFSNTLRMMVIVELTCPCEENIEERHLEKQGKYVDEFVSKAEKNGWKVQVFAVEVGARGYVAWSLRTCLRFLGVSWEASATALRWSFWIWVKRDSQEWWCNSSNCDGANQVTEDAAIEDINQVAANCSGVIEDKQVDAVVEASNDNCGDINVAVGTRVEEENEVIGSNQVPFTNNGNSSVEQSDHVRSELMVREVVTSQDIDASVTQMIQEIRQSTAVVKTPIKFPEGKKVTSRGLKNLGNTCYLNAVLQCLWVVIGQLVKTLPHTSNLVNQFWLLMGKMSADQKGNLVIAPSGIKNALDNEYPQFRGQRQHDAHELLMIMLEQLSPTVKDFVGSISSFLTCLKCGHTAEKIEPFTCLDVEIPRRGRGISISLYDCMEEEFMEEVVADGWRCAKCCENSKAKNERFIKEVPNILVIQLKRFMYTAKGYVKDNSKILLPRNVFKLGSEMYRLKGMVNHHGSIRSGHYTACI